MEAQGPITEDDFQLTEEELAELDRRVAEADRLQAAGVELIRAEDFFAQQKAKFRLAS